MSEDFKVGDWVVCISDEHNDYHVIKPIKNTPYKVTCIYYDDNTVDLKGRINDSGRIWECPDYTNFIKSYFKKIDDKDLELVNLLYNKEQ